VLDGSNYPEARAFSDLLVRTSERERDEEGEGEGGREGGREEGGRGGTREGGTCIER
jgi:hypothetical protein